MAVIFLGGCATTGIGAKRSAKIVIAPCPAKQIWKESKFAYHKDGQWMLPDENYRELTQWIRDWQACAEARGAAIEEINR